MKASDLDAALSGDGRPDDEEPTTEAAQPIPGGGIEGAIWGERPIYDAEDVVRESGLPLEDVTRLWRALGFPETGAAIAFTPADVRAVGTVLGSIDDGLIDLDLAVNLTRAVGQTMARLSDWEVSALVHRVEELEALERRSGSDGQETDEQETDGQETPALDPHAYGTRAGSARRLVESFSKPFEELLIYAWRRHLAAAVTRMEALGAAEEDLHTTGLTVGFADIVSFTALSNQMSEERIGDLVEIFESRCADVVASQSGRVIKSIGDAVLFVSTDPIRAYDIAEGIITVIGRDSRMPDVRVGLATGSVVLRLGDVFGPPVNMAARLTAVARRNRVIIDAATAAALPGDQFETRRLPARPVRGFGLVEPVAVRRH